MYGSLVPYLLTPGESFTEKVEYAGAEAPRAGCICWCLDDCKNDVWIKIYCNIKGDQGVYIQGVDTYLGRHLSGQQATILPIGFNT